MADKTSETSREERGNALDAPMNASEVEAWFVREVLPLESMLMRFLHQNWRNKADIEDFRQEIYAQVLTAAENGIPERAKPFVLTTARNLLIDRVRREHVVPIDAVSDLDALGVAIDEPGPERSTIARDVLRRLQDALDRLPPRCREAFTLKRLEGFSRAEVAQRMGISERMVTEHMAQAVCQLADMLYGEPADTRGKQ
ncbi:MAG TPA: RNA polymerase sigma factor [Rhizomicrobium sp.]|nr:RNA polymerase sigma factor [Rhizomicrobium sp.]